MLKKWYTVIKHNLWVFLVMLAMEFYKYVYWTKEKYNVYIKKENSIKYQAKKLVEEMERDDHKAMNKHIFAREMLSKFIKDSDIVIHYAFYFNNLSLLRYISDYDLIIDLLEANAAMTPGEMLEYMFKKKMINKREFEFKFSEEQREFFYTCTLKEAVKDLEKP
jgi:hypothetical protein